MKLTHHRIDINKCAEAGHPPQDVIERLPGDVWLTSMDAIYLDQPIKWCQYKSEKHVMIPLVPYRLDPNPDLALAFMFSLGVRISYDLGRPVKRLHIATGTPLSDGSDHPEGKVQYWAGFGLVIE